MDTFSRLGKEPNLLKGFLVSLVMSWIDLGVSLSLPDTYLWSDVDVLCGFPDN